MFVNGRRRCIRGRNEVRIGGRRFVKAQGWWLVGLCLSAVYTGRHLISRSRSSNLPSVCRAKDQYTSMNIEPYHLQLVTYLCIFALRSHSCVVARDTRRGSYEQHPWVHCVGVGATRLRDPRRRFVNGTLTLASRRITRCDLRLLAAVAIKPPPPHHQLPSATIKYATGPRAQVC